MMRKPGGRKQPRVRPATRNGLHGSPLLELDVLATPDTCHQAGIRRGTATSHFHPQRDNLRTMARQVLQALAKFEDRVAVNLPARAIQRFHAVHAAIAADPVQDGRD